MFYYQSADTPVIYHIIPKIKKIEAELILIPIYQQHPNSTIREKMQVGEI